MFVTYDENGISELSDDERCSRITRYTLLNSVLLDERQGGTESPLLSRCHQLCHVVNLSLVPHHRIRDSIASWQQLHRLARMLMGPLPPLGPLAVWPAQSRRHRRHNQSVRSKSLSFLLYPRP